jgi:uracil-DNA glycosylase family 4
LVANVCQSQPPGNKIELFKWDGPEIQSGLAQLTLDMARFQPQFILCLGGTALRAFKGVKVSIDDYRGTLFLAGAVAPGVKCMATFHPARVLREFGLTGICRFDYKRAAEEARTDELFVPVRHIRLLMPEGKGFDA